MLRSLRCLFLLSALPLCAQGPQFGLVGAMANPEGGIASGADPAPTFGIEGRFPVFRGLALVAYLHQSRHTGHEMVDYHSSTYPYYSQVNASKETSIQTLGLDADYYFSRKVGQGFHLGGGLATLDIEKDLSLPKNIVVRSNTRQMYSRLAFTLRTGYAFNRHVGMYAHLMFFGDEKTGEVYNTSTHKTQDVYKSSTLLNLGVSFHF